MTPAEAARAIAAREISMTTAITRVQAEARARGEWPDRDQVWSMIWAQMQQIQPEGVSS